MREACILRILSFPQEQEQGAYLPRGMQEPAGLLSVGESAPAATAPTEAVGAVRPEPAFTQTAGGSSDLDGAEPSELASDPPPSDPAPEPEGASADAPTDGEAQAVELSEAQAMEVIAAVEAVRAGGATAETELHGWHIGFSVRAVAKGKAEASPQLRSRSLSPPRCLSTHSCFSSSLVVV